MIRILVEIVNFMGCVVAGMMGLIGIGLAIVCIFAGVLAWALFAAASELDKAHGAGEVSS